MRLIVLQLQASSHSLQPGVACPGDVWQSWPSPNCHQFNEDTHLVLLTSGKWWYVKCSEETVWSEAFYTNPAPNSREWATVIWKLFPTSSLWWPFPTFQGLCHSATLGHYWMLVNIFPGHPPHHKPWKYFHKDEKIVISKGFIMEQNNLEIEFRVYGGIQCVLEMKIWSYKCWVTQNICRSFWKLC